MDLYMMLCEYEQYYEMKFMKPPVIVKKAPENKKINLPNITKPGSKPTIKTKSVDKTEKEEEKIEIQGNQIVLPSIKVRKTKKKRKLMKPKNSMKTEL